MACWEVLTPRRHTPSDKLTRWMNNLTMSVINVLVLRVLFMSGAIGTAIYVEAEGWGLLNHLILPVWADGLLALFVLDLVVYGQHVLFHSVPFFWRMHKVHHSDIELDVTTGIRFHPGEMVISLFIKMGTIMLVGVSPGVVLIFEVLLNATAMFNHSNVTIPLTVDHWLRKLVVTPDMHRIHHSVISEESTRNYGFNLSWWDRAFGTYRHQPSLGHEHMPLGLEQYRDPGHLTWPHLLALPFLKDPNIQPSNQGALHNPEQVSERDRLKRMVKTEAKALM